MADEPQEYRYSDKELALILKRATELDADLEHGAPSPVHLPHNPDGLTLRQIQEIAGEVGLNPARILQAADSLAVEGLKGTDRLLGGPLRIRARRTLLKELEPVKQRRLLEVVRDVLGVPGEAHEVLGGVEWKGTRRSDTIIVRVVPDEGRTGIHITVQRDLSFFLSHWFPFLLGGGLAGVTLGILEPGSAGAVAGIVVGGLGTGLAVGRSLFSAGSRQWRRLLDRAADGMVREGEKE
jgi:hypothetical protein